MFDQAEAPEKVAQFGLQFAEDSLDRWAVSDAIHVLRKVIEHTTGTPGRSGRRPSISP